MTCSQASRRYPRAGRSRRGGQGNGCADGRDQRKMLQICLVSGRWQKPGREIQETHTVHDQESRAHLVDIPTKVQRVRGDEHTPSVRNGRLSPYARPGCIPFRLSAADA
ncbi:hypothetical protein HETIRDRAFT_326917 [Heterobasidion irregulare TC 32-1]|uniref:Uncharacterized protein n=1 Tax=Heterobasidion irregulare (strain TC 32-1) TaxID=747525 RepID=W4JUE0_HETIT|nr:uncharacterized protein HETIRDRAFT_326917 [Heterobasidion irregulare TC 32-1]ETW77167.1 hypothetical protein HETIRDRAFT_326917 [Heterobasidion irregulare TC 32-1]